MKPILVPFSLTLFSAGLAAQASDADVAAIKREGLENSQVMQILDGLTNGVGYRLTGSDNFTRACEWAREEFAKMGLDAELEEWGEWKIVWNRGQWDARVLAPEPMELQVATPAWTPGTRGRQRGPLVKGPISTAELEALRGKLAGAWVYTPSLPTISRDLPREERRELRLAQRELRAELAKAIAAEGALGRVSSSTGDKKYPDRIRVFGDSRAPRGSWESLPVLPDIVVRRDQAVKLEALLDGGDEVIVEFDIRNRFRPGPIKLHNVIAEIRGTTKPDEIVVVCGHLDSWHQATGTTDNGTGTATTMEAARILAAAGVKPMRTIRFALWGGEEQGLLGSNRHVTMRPKERNKISCVFNHDTGTNWAHSLSVTEKMYEQLEPVFAPIMTLSPPDPAHEGPVFELRKVEAIRGGGGSDHASFLRAGIPGWSWGLTGRADYQFSWHSQWDTYDVAIPEYQKHTATVIALAALGVANMPELLSREGISRGGARDAGAYLGGIMGAEMDGTTFKKVEPEGVAAKAGIQAGDVLKKVNGEAVGRSLQLLRLLRDEDLETITMTLERGEGEVTAAIKRDELLESLRARRGNPRRNQGKGRGGAAAPEPAKTGPAKGAAEAPVKAGTGRGSRSGG